MLVLVETMVVESLHLDIVFILAIILFIGTPRSTILYPYLM